MNRYDGLKICKRSSGIYKTHDIYCGRMLKFNDFYKGKTQCKDCKSKQYKINRRLKKQSKEILILHEKLSKDLLIKKYMYGNSEEIQYLNEVINLLECLI